MVTIQCERNDGLPPLVWEGIEAIFFDKDGTLSRSEDYLCPLGQARAAAIDRRVPGTKAHILKTFGFEGECLNPAGLLPVGSAEENRLAASGQLAAFGKNWFDCLHLVQDAFEEAERSLPPFYTITPLIPGAIEMLHRLNTLPVKVAIVSGDSTANIETFLVHHNLRSGVDGIRGADIPPRKPDPQCFLQVCQELEVSPQSVVMIGDATGDMAMARAAGAAGGIGVLWGWSLPHSIDQADTILEKWDQFAIYV